MPRSQAHLVLVTGSALALVSACSDDPSHPAPNATLADLPGLRLEIVIGMPPDGPARLYVHASNISSGCPTLDETFGITVDGVEIPDVYPGGPDDWQCGRPAGAIDLAADARPAVIRMYDASHEVVARLDPRLVEPRSLTLTSHPSWSIAAGERVSLTASHPDDFARPVRSAYFQTPPSVPIQTIEPVLDGDQVGFPMPAGLEDADEAELRVVFPPTALAAASCLGATACTFDWFPGTYVLGIER